MCSSKSSPQVSKALPKPPIEVSLERRQVLKQIASEQKLGEELVAPASTWSGSRYGADRDPDLVRERPGESDVVHDADGIRCAMPKELTTYLKGVQIEWI